MLIMNNIHDVTPPLLTGFTRSFESTPHRLRAARMPETPLEPSVGCLFFVSLTKVGRAADQNWTSVWT